MAVSICNGLHSQLVKNACFELTSVSAVGTRQINAFINTSCVYICLCVLFLFTVGALSLNKGHSMSPQHFPTKPSRHFGVHAFPVIVQRVISQHGCSEHVYEQTRILVLLRGYR